MDSDAVRPSFSESPSFRIQPIFESMAGKAGSHAPTVVAFDDGELLAAWYSYDGPHELNGAAIYTARRAAGEGAWSAPALLIDRPESDGNPVLYREGEHLWLFQAVTAISWATSGIEWQESSDRGGSWSEARRIDGPLGSNVRFPPLRTGEGELLLPAYDDLLNRSQFFVLVGGEWRPRSTVSTGPLLPIIQPSVVRLSGGDLLSVMRGGEDSWLWASRSADDGRSWTTPIDAGLPNDGASTALIRLTDGNLVMAYDQTQEKTSRLVAALSADEGRTWLPPLELIGGEGEFRYPSMTQGPDGVIHLVYSHNRQNIGHIELNAAWLAR